MKKLLLPLIIFNFIFLSLTELYSLNLKAGVKGGMGINWTQKSADDDTGAIIGATGGTAFEIGGPIGQQNEFIAWGLEVNALYQERGGEFITGNGEVRYLGVPVILKLDFIPIYYMGMGLNYQKKISSTISNLKENNLEFIMLIGFDTSITKNLDFVFDFRFYAGLLNYSADPSNTIKTQSIELLFGVMYKIF